MLWMLIAALSFASDAPTSCNMDVPPETPFAFELELTSTRHLMVMVEVWLDGADPDWVDQVLSTLEQRDLNAAVVTSSWLRQESVDQFTAALSEKGIPISPKPVLDSRESAEVLSRALSGGHEVVVHVDPALLPGKESGLDPSFSSRFLSRSLREARKFTLGVRPHAAAAQLSRRTTEATLVAGGFRSVLDLPGLEVARPRKAATFPGETTVGYILSVGPYRDDCENQALPWTPATADRASRAIKEASLSHEVGPRLVRITLDGSKGTDSDADILARWLDQVVLPAGVRVALPADVRRIAMRTASRLTPEEAPQQDAATLGRTLSRSQVSEAAQAIAGATQIPRELPGGITPTEAFCAFLLVLSDQAGEDAVQLKIAKGPRSLAESSLTGSIEVRPAAVQELAAALMLAWPTHIPAALPVDGTLLTAPEVLTLLASAVRGDDPPVARPIAVPDPRAEGLGWGESTKP